LLLLLLPLLLLGLLLAPRLGRGRRLARAGGGRARRVALLLFWFFWGFVLGRV
jgi:hypothetical protein